MCFIFLYLFQYQQDTNRQLPILGPQDFNPKLVDHGVSNITTEHQVSDFSLVNQHGDVITQEHFQDKIYVVDFFFTSCPSICPVMAANMAELQKIFVDDARIMLLSISVTPDVDDVPKLSEYARKQGAIASKWQITTGDKKHIYQLARKSYFAVLSEGDGGLQDFIHTPNFVLVDEKKRIRGVYDGTNDDEIKRLVDDIRLLRGH